MAGDAERAYLDGMTATLAACPIDTRVEANITVTVVFVRGFGDFWVPQRVAVETLESSSLARLYPTFEEDGDANVDGES